MTGARGKGVPVADGGAFDVAVVGSGFGGLTAGAFLAKAGRRVLLCEQHDRAGGFGHSWARKAKIRGQRMRVSFDASVHDVSGAYPGGPVRTILGKLGLDGNFQWAPVSHRYLLPDLALDVPREFAAFERELRRLFPRDAAALGRLFETMRRCDAELRAIGRFTAGIPRMPLNAAEMQRFATVCPTITELIGVSYADALGPDMDPRLRRLLGLISSYTMESPQDASFLHMMPLFSYYIHGGHYPRGGMQVVADALVDLVVERGGAFLPRCRVTGIEIEDGAAAGIRTRGGNFRARAVVSNADIAQTVALLPPSLALRPAAARRLQAFQPSNSAAMVFLVLDGDPGLAGCTIISDDASGGIIVSAPPFPEERAAPGLFTLTITALISAGEAKNWDRRQRGYRASKVQIGDRMIAIASKYIHDLQDRIVFREDSTPATLARYIGSTGGAAYGASPGTRWPGSQTPVPGLHVVGASVGLGPGIEAVMIGGASLAEQLAGSLEGGS